MIVAGHIRALLNVNLRLNTTASKPNDDGRIGEPVKSQLRLE